MARMTILVGALFFLSGFSASTYLLGLFRGSEAVTIDVGAFLLGLGVGSLLANFIADRLTTRGHDPDLRVLRGRYRVVRSRQQILFYDFLFGQMLAYSESAQPSSPRRSSDCLFLRCCESLRQGRCRSSACGTAGNDLIGVADQILSCLIEVRANQVVEIVDCCVSAMTTDSA
jgi:hypothetical protein